MPNTFKAYLSSKLAAAGSETTIYLDRVTTITGETILTSHFATLGRGILSINPDGDGQTSYPEWASFTAVSGTTLTGVTRGLSALSNSVVAANKRYHPVGTPVVISFGVHNVQDLIDYVDDQVGAASIGTGNVVLATAGEDVASGELVYLKDDGKWWLTDANTIATVDGVQLGIAQGAGSTDGNITGGVLLKGLDSNQSGLVAGTTYYASDTAGAISDSAGTNSRIIGVGKSTTTLYFDNNYGQLLSIPEKAFVTQIYTGLPGTVIDYAGATVPTGWLECLGTAVSRTTYSALFAAIGTVWGSGDGSTTFNLPDCRNRTRIGAGTGTVIATFASRSSNVITVTGLTDVANNEFQTGQAVLYSAASGAMTGLTHNTTYYIVRTGNLTFSLASSLANAQNGTVISLSSDGTGTQTFTLTRTARTIGGTGGEENHAMSLTELLAHTHSYTKEDYETGGGGGSSQYNVQSSQNTGSSGGNVTMNNMQPFIVMKTIIKY